MMKIENPDLLKSYRKPGKCRACGKKCPMLCGHHLWTKGSGQVDIPCNLVDIGFDPFRDCKCHVTHHDGNEPTFEQLLALSAQDHDCLQGDIEDLVTLIRRMPPIRDVDEGRYTQIVNRELNFSARRLAMKELATFRHLLRRS